MTQSLAFGETMHCIKAPKYTRELEKTVLALLPFGAGDGDKLFLLSESEFPELVNMGLIKKILFYYL